MKMTVFGMGAVLVGLHMVTAAQAATLCVSGSLCDDRPQSFGSAQSNASPISWLTQDLHLDVQASMGRALLGQLEMSPIVLIPFRNAVGWNYAFSASERVRSVVMPYFADSEIFAVGVPEGWTYAVAVPDSSGKSTATWQRQGAETISAVLSFKSSHSPSEATYQFVLDDGSTRLTPVFIPYSPMARAAGYTGFAATVPESSTLTLMALGLVFIAASRGGKARI